MAQRIYLLGKVRVSERSSIKSMIYYLHTALQNRLKQQATNQKYSSFLPCPHLKDERRLPTVLSFCMSTSDTPIFYKHWTTIYVKEFPTLQNIMFNIYSNEQPLPFTCKTKHNRPYYISKEDADKMAESIKEEERCLTKKYKSSRMEQEVAEIPMITLDDDMETIHCIEEVDLEQPIHHEQPKKSYKERNEPQCVQIPTINIETLSAISKDQDKESVLTGDESMLNYKINRQRYHAFCQNQAIKEEQAKKQKKQRRISRKVEGLQAQRKHTKGKTWKAQATSIKKILTASKNTEKPPKDPILIMTMIQKETIPTMYQLSPAQANSVDYSPSANEDTFFSSVFEIIKADMQYARIYKLRQSNLSKIRTFIVRRILDDFVAQRHQDSPEQRQHLARHNRRITRFDRNRYLQAGISEPPSRMKSQYLQQIFQNQSFCEYYIKYLTSQRLKKYMQESNEEITERYWKDILAISNRDKLTLSQKVTLFKEIKRKPLFRSQIAEYLEEGNMIRIEYCKDKEHGYPQ